MWDSPHGRLRLSQIIAYSSIIARRVAKSRNSNHLGTDIFERTDLSVRRLLWRGRQKVVSIDDLVEKRQANWATWNEEVRRWWISGLMQTRLWERERESIEIETFLRNDSLFALRYVWVATENFTSLTTLEKNDLTAFEDGFFGDVKGCYHMIHGREKSGESESVCVTLTKVSGLIPLSPSICSFKLKGEQNREEGERAGRGEDKDKDVVRGERHFETWGEEIRVWPQFAQDESQLIHFARRVGIISSCDAIQCIGSEECTWKGSGRRGGMEERKWEDG